MNEKQSMLMVLGQQAMTIAVLQQNVQALKQANDELQAKLPKRKTAIPAEKTLDNLRKQ